MIDSRHIGVQFYGDDLHEINRRFAEIETWIRTMLAEGQHLDDALKANFATKLAVVRGRTHSANRQE